MTADEVKKSPHWPADVTATEDISDRWCPLNAAYILRRKAPELPAYVTNPLAIDIKDLWVIDMEDAGRIIDEMFGRAPPTPPMAWSEST